MNSNRQKRNVRSVVSSFWLVGVVLVLPPGDVVPANASIESNIHEALIEVAPLDLNFDSDGFADFLRSYHEGTIVTAVTATAPLTANGRKFIRWSIDGELLPVGVRTVEVVVTESSFLRAFYSRNTRVGPGWPISEEDGDLD